DSNLIGNGQALDIIENSGDGTQSSVRQFMGNVQLKSYVTQYWNDQSIGHLDDLFRNNDALNSFLNGGSEVPKN
ncbi:hypothetical protein, partial [Nocardia sp. NPDC004722]